VLVGLVDETFGNPSSVSEGRQPPPIGMREVRLTIPARAEYVLLGRLALSGITRTQPLDEETVSDLKLAVTEACTNSVRHAYAENGGTVDIVYELYDDRLVVEVSDDGGGFDPNELVEAGELTEGGLGIAIIRAIVDEFEVGERGDGRGFRLRFVKFLTA
jgi:serine/threonine-protein kinase RsbW